MSPILNPAPLWQPDRSDYVILWHGCTAFDKTDIEKGIDLARCQVSADFGRGFYTTTIERQARHWAWNRFYQWRSMNPGGTGNQPVVLRFRVRRYYNQPVGGGITWHEVGLDSLRTLAFVSGEYDADDYWSLVQHCRQSTLAAVNDHRCPTTGWYDLVIGPVAAFWEQRVAMSDSDQFSFHTGAAINLLDALIQQGLKAGPQGHPDYYTWKVVP